MTEAGEIQVTVAANPSHLEAVDPVVEGLARAEQTDRSAGAGIHDPDGRTADPHPRRRVLRGAGRRRGDVQPALARRLLDGRDASPHRQQPGRLHDRSRRGTLDALLERPREGLRRADHPRQRRRSRGGHRGDRARARLPRGVRTRRRRRSRRLPAIRPQRAGRGRVHPAAAGRAHRAAASGARDVREAAPRRRRRRRDGGGADARGDARRASFRARRSQAVVRRCRCLRPRARRAPTREPPFVTAVPAERIRELNEQLLRVPDGFDLNPKLAKQLERRRDALDEGGVDWGHAEALAFASLLEEGIPIRLSGQDTERGTFSHRHAVLHDPRTGETYTPLQHLPTAGASFEIYNSPLSEYAALAFEHGYSIAAPDALVLWEAQFGDFVNGAQIVVDQFIVSGRSKWGQTSRLALLLPHGYEGNGPEHSSARLERFLQLAAQDNIRVVNCTTAGQFFHLLRRQALDATARPLVVMTPKGLLRLREATSTLADLAESCVPARDRRPAAPTTRASSGSSCAAARSTTTSRRTSSAPRLRVPPSPASSSSTRSRASRCRRSSRPIPHLREIVWAQEEPQNMGAWRSLRHRLEEAASHASRRLARAVRRPARGARARARATRRCISTSRTGSCARRSPAFRPRLSAAARATTRDEGRFGEQPDDRLALLRRQSPPRPVGEERHGRRPQPAEEEHGDGEDEGWHGRHPRRCRPRSAGRLIG